MASRQGTARLAHQVQFRVTGDVAFRDDGVLRLAEHVAGRGGQQGAERMVTVAPGTLGHANGSREEPLILRCKGGQRGSFRSRLIRVVRCLDFRNAHRAAQHDPPCCRRPARSARIAWWSRIPRRE